MGNDSGGDKGKRGGRKKYGIRVQEGLERWKGNIMRKKMEENIGKG